MRNPEYSSVDPESGNVRFNGLLSLEKGDHSHMPSTTDAYLPGDEKGHVQASSLGGVNSEENVVPQHRDLNHGAYMAVERGERTALKNGAVIASDKTAVVDSQPGDRPYAFTVADAVTYQDGHTEMIYNSFTNESYADQEAWNRASAAMPETFEGNNPEDELRSSMDTEEYAALMEETDSQLPGLAADYAPADFSGTPGPDSDADTDADTNDANAEGDADSDLDPDPD